MNLLIETTLKPSEQVTTDPTSGKTATTEFFTSAVKQQNVESTTEPYVGPTTETTIMEEKSTSEVSATSTEDHERSTDTGKTTKYGKSQAKTTPNPNEITSTDSHVETDQVNTSQLPSSLHLSTCKCPPVKSCSSKRNVTLNLTLSYESNSKKEDQSYSDMTKSDYRPSAIAIGIVEVTLAGGFLIIVIAMDVPLMLKALKLFTHI